MIKPLTHEQRKMEIRSAIHNIQILLNGFNAVEQFGILESVKMDLNNKLIKTSILEILREIEEE